MLNTFRPAHTEPVGVHVLLQRIQSEFLEMPGLRLTCRQAQRLWNIDALVCESVLAALVDAGFLTQTADGIFAQRAAR